MRSKPEGFGRAGQNHVRCGRNPKVAPHAQRHRRCHKGPDHTGTVKSGREPLHGVPPARPPWSYNDFGGPWQDKRSAYTGSRERCGRSLRDAVRNRCKCTHIDEIDEAWASKHCLTTPGTWTRCSTRRRLDHDSMVVVQVPCTPKKVHTTIAARRTSEAVTPMRADERAKPLLRAACAELATPSLGSVVAPMDTIDGARLCLNVGMDMSQRQEKEKADSASTQVSSVSEETWLNSVLWRS